MIEKLRDILGMLSGYKQEYEAAKAELDDVKSIIIEAEPIADQILAILRNWHDGTNNKAK